MLLATPVFTHYDLARRCLEADKHTFVEKPLAPSTAQAQELIALADERELSLMCGHTFLYSPPVRAVRELIDDGRARAALLRISSAASTSASTSATSA